MLPQQVGDRCVQKLDVDYDDEDDDIYAMSTQWE